MKITKGKKAVQDYYDNYYLKEHEEYFSRAKNMQEAKFLIDFLGKTPNSVCDVGCGDGRHLIAFKKAGVTNGFGFDLSSKLVDLANKNLSENSNFVVENMPFSDWQPKQEEYDITYSIFSSFSYCLGITVAQDLVSKMVSATANDGVICIDVDNIFRLVQFLLNKRNIKVASELTFDAVNMLLQAREEKKGVVLESQTCYFMALDFKRMFIEAGINEEHIFFTGGFDGDQYSYKSARLIVLAKKAG